MKIQGLGRTTNTDGSVSLLVVNDMPDNCFAIFVKNENAKKLLELLKSDEELPLNGE